MSRKGDIHIEIMRRLRENPTLQSYIRNIWDWNVDFSREENLTANLPAILLTPLPSDEEYADFPKRKQDFYRMEIRGVLYIKDRIEMGKTVMLEDGNYPGFYKMEDDIKNALENWQTGVGDNLSYNQGGVPGGTPTGHYPKFKTTAYTNLGQNVSGEVVIELEIDSRYFFVGQR